MLTTEPAVPALRLKVLGPIRIEIDGRDVRLAPHATAVLVRLAVAAGEAVTADEIYRDVWPRNQPGRTAAERRPNRVMVHKRIAELRAVLDPERRGEASRVLVTERGARSAYRLLSDHVRSDLSRFQELVTQARRSAPANAADLWSEALALWRGRPLFDVERLPFAVAHIAHLNSLRDEARRGLFEAYRALGLAGEALAVGQELAADFPGDAALAAAIDDIRRSVKTRDTVLLSQRFDELGTTVTLVEGDLFDQQDAHLVVGFTDTFDTLDEGDRLVNPDTVQSQMLRRVYHGERERLERDLRAELRSVPRIGSLDRAVKPEGKLVRYPVGTVAVLKVGDGRRVFAVAYSRWAEAGNMVGSSYADLRGSLQELWRAAYLRGQRRPIAVTLLGSGLARISDAGPDRLLLLIVESYLESCRERLVAAELRIVLRSENVGRLDLPGLAGRLRTLRGDRV